jgi:PTS system fructose-specific IIA component/PTS system nitrogen regulatory IIA component
MLLDLDAGSKDAVIEKMVEAAAAAGKIKRSKNAEVIEKVMAREEVGSTGIGRGVAVPHAKSSSVKELIGVFARTKRPLDFSALDGQPVDLVFLLLAPAPSAGDHLGVLALVARIARDELYCRFLRQAKTPQDALEVLKEAMEGMGG